MKNITKDSQIYLYSEGAILSFAIPQELKRVKVVDAFVTIDLDTQNTQAKSFDILYLNGAAEPWGVIDRVTLPIKDAKLKINISDELQDALDKKSGELKLQFSDTTVPLAAAHTFSWNIDYQSLAEYQKNASSQSFDLKKCGIASVNHITGKLSLGVPLVKSESSVLPLSIAASYNAGSSELVGGTGMPDNWRLNVQQFLVKNEEASDRLSFTYIDGEGKEQLIEERYYYVDEEDNKVYVPREQVSIEADGTLKYTGRIRKSIYSLNGLSASMGPNIQRFYKSKSFMNNFVNALKPYLDKELYVDYKSLHTKTLNCQVIQNVESHIKLRLYNDESEYGFELMYEPMGEDDQDPGTYWNNCIVITSELGADGDYEFYTYYTCEIKTTLETENNLKLVSSIKDLKGHKTIDFEPEEIVELRQQVEQLNKNKITLEKNYSNLKYQILSSCLSREKTALERMNYYSNCTPTTAENAIYKRPLVHESDIWGSAIEAFQHILKIENEDTVREKIREYFDGKDFANYYNELENSGTYKETLKNFFTGDKDKIWVTPAIADVDFYNVDLGLKNSFDQLPEYKEQLELIEDNIKKYEYKLMELEKQCPVHYLTNDNNIIYGFGKTGDKNVFRLILIADAYENTIYIEYKDFETNQLASVMDDSGKIISFEYLDGALSKIVDANENALELKTENAKLSEICFADGNVLHYYYDSDKLVGAMDKSYLGAMFTYDALNKVSKVNSVSALSNVVGGEIKSKDDFDFNSPNLPNHIVDDDFVEFAYNNYKSTTVRNGGGKSITYLFDKLGKTRAVYELNGKAGEDDTGTAAQNAKERCVKVTNFEYEDQNVALSTQNLLNSPDYLDDESFSASKKSTLSNLYLGGFTLGSDAVSYSYEVENNTHSIPASAERKVDFMSMSSLNIHRINNSEDICEHRCFMLSGFAKADSAFIITEEEETFPSYVSARKFEIRAEIKYAGEDEIKAFSQSFDWRNTDWQYCSLPLVLENRAVESITCYLDYSNNLGQIEFTDLEFREADFERTYYREKKPYMKESGHSKYVCLYDYCEDKLVCETVKDKVTGEEFKTHYCYNKQGNVVRVEDYNELVHETIYNDKGLAIKSLTYNKNEPALAFVQEHKLDDKGNERTTLNEFAELVSESEVDHLGNVVGIKDKNNNMIKYGYDRNRNVVQMLSTAEDKTNANTYGYALDFLTSLSHNDFDITYSYDNRGRISSVDIAGNNYLQKSYQKNEETTSLASGEKFRLEYNNDGKLLRTFYKAKGADEGAAATEVLLEENIYDTFGNLASTKSAVDKSVGILNFVTHTMNQALASYVETKYYYDKLGNLILKREVQNQKEVSFENIYDSEHKNVLSSKITIGSESPMTYEYLYDKTLDGGLQSVKLPSGIMCAVAKDKLGRVAKLSCGNIASSFKYLTKNGQTSNLISELGFASNNSLEERLSYKYDEKGNIREVRKNNNLLARYSYDGLSRLIREDNKVFDKTFTLTYDEGGNILEKRMYAFTLIENLEFEDYSVIEYRYPLSGWRDQLVKVIKNGIEENFAYDALGNPTTYRGNSLSWSCGRQLDRFGENVSFKYNISGIRTSKTVGDKTIKYYLNGNKIVRQETGEEVMDFFYGANGLCGFSLNGQNYSYKKNAQNDIIGIYDSTGKQIVKYDYDAWGVQTLSYFVEECEEYAQVDINAYTDNSNINQYVALHNPFRYRSYYYDTETGLYYLNSRYYDPELGRFVNADSIDNIDEETLNGLNLYAYCLDNPIFYTDSDGNKPKWWQWLLFGIGAVLVVAAAVVLTVVSGGAATGLLAAVAVGAAKGALIGAAVGAAVGIAGGAIYSAVTGADLGESILSGFLMGFGIGAIAGAVIGGSVGGLSYSPTGLSRSAVKEGVKSTISNSNKMNHIMQPKHNLPGSTKDIGKLMQKTLTRGTYAPYKSVSSVTWKGYQVTYKIIENIIKISDMWFLL